MVCLQYVSAVWCWRNTMQVPCRHLTLGFFWLKRKFSLHLLYDVPCFLSLTEGFWLCHSALVTLPLFQILRYIKTQFHHQTFSLHIFFFRMELALILAELSLFFFFWYLNHSENVTVTICWNSHIRPTLMTNIRE